MVEPMSSLAKTAAWWNSKAPSGKKWEQLTEEQKVQAAWDASLALRADIVDVQALRWACSQIEELYSTEQDDQKKREIGVYLDRLEKMRLACLAYK